MAIDARLTIGVVVLVSMSACLRRVAGFVCVVQPVRQACASSRVQCLRPRLWDSNNNNRMRARRGNTAVRMASELSKTAISMMRVQELREELESRGMETTGIRPILQARLGEAAEIERAQRILDRSHRQGSSSSSSSVNIGVARGMAPPVLPQARCVNLVSERRGLASQRANSALGGAQELRARTRLQESLYVMQFDGGSRGNPGPSGAGAVLYRLDDFGGREEVWSASVWVGQACTNNEAEYSGLIEGLRAATELGLKRLAVEGDSKLIIQQMLGNYKVSSPKMRPLFKKAKVLADTFDELDLEHIKRALNGRADTLANIAMDTRDSSSCTQSSFYESLAVS